VKVRAALLAVAFLVPSSGMQAALGRDKQSPADVVDSGSFGVFMNGRRVATENFSIQQGPGGSVITSEFKADAGSSEGAQSSTLQLSPSGDLQKYEWKELSPGKSQAVVTPNDNFLIERFSNTPAEKMQEQPFLLPASTSILDDYFFIQREVLTWRYLATSCRRDKGLVQCPQNQKAQLGVVNPHARSSMLVSMQAAGKEKVAIRGAERELNRFNLKSDSGDWALWLDDEFKLIRIVASDNSEVVRD
jgi:hypothetical protein